ncbi:hypothetical protein FRX31_017070 [Thalictrum thalictroides]|uniref:Receptor-like protein kinase n=1 Tax=Thalictrum thalictroides TaxID=46969 RepID=A0A7J6W8V1_THATH|nr:hypothetical protein FRX31_017070 [Thalictrum thalictroides]
MDPQSIFKGNNELCGDLIKKKRKGDEPSQNTTNLDVNGKNERDQSELSGFYIGIASGIIVGFWGVFCVLLFKTSWRYAYFRFIENTTDVLYVKLVVRRAWLKKKLECNQVQE